jgi:hypothetical protein
MKTASLKKTVLAGLAFGSLLVSQSLHADTTVFFAGGNASQSILFDRVTNILTGGISKAVISPTNGSVRTYVGTIASQPGLGTVTVHFSQLGAVGGFQDVANQNTEVTATTNNLVPNVAVSSTSPEAVGISPAPFTQVRSLVVPFVFIKNTNLSPNLVTVTNLTQRQAAYLEGAAGTLPSAFFGGSSASDIVYLVARNTAAAVRTEIDANIYFTGTISSYTTNAIGQPIPDLNGGLANGGAVVNHLKVITNAIGTVAAQDFPATTAGFATIAYEGVPFSITNVETCSYPIWGYERWAYLKTGQTGAPSANQLNVITSLLSAVTNATFQTTSPLFTGKFARLSLLQVDRSSMADRSPPPFTKTSTGIFHEKNPSTDARGFRPAGGHAAAGVELSRRRRVADFSREQLQRRRV